MRLWSISPKYLDSIGLVAVWRESLLAKKVLEEKTKGYKNHPQLDRFKKNPNPLKSINTYLNYIFLESKKRGFNFDETKFKNYKLKKIISVSTDQINFEFEHLQKKLFIRNKEKFLKNNTLLLNEKRINSNKLFKIVNGKLEDWEKI